TSSYTRASGSCQPLRIGTGLLDNSIQLSLRFAKIQTLGSYSINKMLHSLDCHVVNTPLYNWANECQRFFFDTTYLRQHNHVRIDVNMYRQLAIRFSNIQTPRHHTTSRYTHS